MRNTSPFGSVFFSCFWTADTHAVEVGRKHVKSRRPITMLLEAFVRSNFADGTNVDITGSACVSYINIPGAGCWDAEKLKGTQNCRDASSPNTCYIDFGCVKHGIYFQVFIAPTERFPSVVITVRLVIRYGLVTIFSVSFRRGTVRRAETAGHHAVTFTSGRHRPAERVMVEYLTSNPFVRFQWIRPHKAFGIHHCFIIHISERRRTVRNADTKLTGGATGSAKALKKKNDKRRVT